MIDTRPDPARREDTDELKWLADEYGYAIDLQQPDRWLGVFHEDAEFRCELPPPLQDRVCRGHAEIADFADEVWTNYTLCNHFTLAQQIGFTGPDTAEGYGRCACMFVLRDGTYLTVGALYTDRFERREGVWRFSYRRIGLVHSTAHPEAAVTLGPNPYVAPKSKLK